MLRTSSNHFFEFCFKYINSIIILTGFGLYIFMPLILFDTKKGPNLFSSDLLIAHVLTKCDIFYCREPDCGNSLCTALAKHIIWNTD